MSVSSTNPFEDSRSNEELFAEALKGDYDDDLPWDAVTRLRWRGSLEVFDLAKKYATSPVAEERGRALDVLAQLGAAKPESEKPYKAESISIAIHSTEDSDPRVFHQAVWALAHLGGDQAVARLITFKQHPDPNIRHAVALGLHGVNDPQAIQTLIELMNDSDDGVRDWATFALGSPFPPADSPEIRAALHKRLHDNYQDARAEAIWGLATRKDPEGLKLLLERLASDDWTSGDESAAEEVLGRTDDPSIEQLREGIRKLLAVAE